MDRTNGTESNDLEDPFLDEEDDEEEEELRLRDLGLLARFLRPLVGPYRRLLVLLGLVLMVEAVFTFSFPVATQYLIDEGLEERNGRVLVGILVFLGIAALCVAVLGVVSEYLGAIIFSAIIRDIRQRLFAHLQTLSLPFYSRTPTGSILSRFSGDIVSLENAFAPIISCLILPLLEVVFPIVLMFWFNVWLALIGMLVFPLILLCPQAFAWKAFALSYHKRRAEARLLSAVQENVSAQPVVQAFGLQQQAQDDFAREGASWLPIAFRVNFLVALIERTAYTSVYLIHLLVFGLGAWWVYEKKLTLGSFVAFEGMFFEMGAALTYVTQFLPTLAQAAGSVQHLDDLMQEKPQVVDAPDAQPAPRLGNEIVFDNVSFKYPSGNFRLRKLNVRIPRGSHVAFVGASGSGKSTILNLLLRFHDPGKGAILLDGRDLRTLTQESLRGQIGIVFQESFLFNLSILENIRMGAPEATLEQVEQAARAAEIHDFIVSLPEGYNTVVGERGSMLSGGQRQRIAIARALVRDPAILILDEATSALDYATEAALLATLRKVAQGRSVINVTHRLNSVVDADHIILLEHGRVREEGTHDSLLEREGHYASLWWKQHRKVVPVKS